MKTEENADVKASEVGSKKIKYAFHITSECMKAIKEMYKKDGSSTRNEFIENDVNFYIDYLKGGTMTNYLAPIIKEWLRQPLKHRSSVSAVTCSRSRWSWERYLTWSQLPMT